MIVSAHDLTIQIATNSLRNLSYKLYLYNNRKCSTRNNSKLTYPFYQAQNITYLFQSVCKYYKNSDPRNQNPFLVVPSLNLHVLLGVQLK